MEQASSPGSIPGRGGSGRIVVGYNYNNSEDGDGEGGDGGDHDEEGDGMARRWERSVRGRAAAGVLTVKGDGTVGREETGHAGGGPYIRVAR